MSGRDDMMRSTSPASLNSLQIALFSLKERCTKQQKKIAELEIDKSEVYNELKKMHEANVKLREKNVSLSHELHIKCKELSEVKELWDRDRSRNEHNVRQIEKLQEDILARHVIVSDSVSDDSNFGEDILSSLKSSTDNVDEEEAVSNNSDVTNNSDDTKMLVDNSKKSMIDIKTTLLTQQAKITKAIETLKQRKSVTDQTAERLISSVLTSAIARSGGQDGEVGTNQNVIATKCCPMCEIVFPADISQDEFESHVVEHFSYEESETLRNFDTVPDAFWPGIEHDPEM